MSTCAMDLLFNCSSQTLVGSSSFHLCEVGSQCMLSVILTRYLTSLLFFMIFYFNIHFADNFTFKGDFCHLDLVNVQNFQRNAPAMGEIKSKKMSNWLSWIGRNKGGYLYIYRYPIVKASWTFSEIKVEGENLFRFLFTNYPWYCGFCQEKCQCYKL